MLNYVIQCTNFLPNTQKKTHEMKKSKPAYSTLLFNGGNGMLTGVGVLISLLNLPSIDSSDIVRACEVVCSWLVIVFSATAAVAVDLVIYWQDGL